MEAEEDEDQALGRRVKAKDTVVGKGCGEAVIEKPETGALESEVAEREQHHRLVPAVRRRSALLNRCDSLYYLYYRFGILGCNGDAQLFSWSQCDTAHGSGIPTRLYQSELFVAGTEGR